MDDSVWLQRIGDLRQLMSGCHLCPRACGVDRRRGERGYCHGGLDVEIASVSVHHGVEPCLTGDAGSGTIFLTGCNLGCVFCQNASVSRGHHGQRYTIRQLISAMRWLAEVGCANLHWVSPTHYTPQLVTALSVLRARDIDVPVVYNCGGYESVETLRLLDGIVDIYLPDFKYGTAEAAERLGAPSDYPEVAKAAIAEMYRQVGELVVDQNGVAKRGLIVRHLVLPNDCGATESVLHFIAEEVSRDTFVSLMAQYMPTYMAFGIPDIARPINRSEWERAVQMARDMGLHRLHTWAVDAESGAESK